MFGFRGTGHFEKSSLALLATSSIGRILWPDVYEVKSHIFGFMPPALEKAALRLEGRRKLSCRGKPGGKRAVAMLLSGNAVDHRMAAMSRICSRYRSTGIMLASADSTLVFVE